MFKKPERSDMEIINNHEPFLYKLVGTWAFSPHPKNWRLFLDWFNSIEDVDTFDPYVPGIVTSDWLHMHNSMGKRHMTWVNIKHIKPTKKPDLNIPKGSNNYGMRLVKLKHADILDEQEELNVE